MVYGYARVSTLGQARDGNSLEAQENALRQAGAERIFKDVYRGKTERRPQLDRLMKVIDYGDKLIITRLDRIASSLILYNLPRFKISISVPNRFAFHST